MKIIKKPAFLFLIILLIFFACNKTPTSPTLPIPPKPKANVSIAITVDPFLYVYNSIYNYYWSAFNVILNEHNNVQVNVTMVKLEFKNQGYIIGTNTYSGGILPANGSLLVHCTPVWYHHANIMKITATGMDVNGYSINVSGKWKL